MKVQEIEIAKIKVDRESRQRKALEGIEELATSIKRLGLIQPIIVDENLVLIAGERRLAAMKQLGKERISAHILSVTSKSKLTLLELEENCNRQDLPWPDKAEALLALSKQLPPQEGKTAQELVAEKTGLSKDHVRKQLKLGAALPSNPQLRNYASWKLAYSSYTIKQSKDVEAKVQQNVAASFETYDQPDGSQITIAEMPTVEVSIPNLDIQKITKAAGLDYTIYRMDFWSWANTYKGERFNFIHADLTNEGLDVEEFLITFCNNYNNLVAGSAHIVFWFNFNHLEQILDTIKNRIPEPFFKAVLLMQHLTDKRTNKPANTYMPIHTHKLGLMGIRGNRPLIKCLPDTFSASSLDPIETFSYFFPMFIDSSTRVLDPMCGEGDALVVAKRLGAKCVLGVESNLELAEKARQNVARG